MEINSLLYLFCVLVLPIGTNTTDVTVTATFPNGQNFKGTGEYIQETVDCCNMVEIRRIIEPAQLNLTDLMGILKTPLIVVIEPEDGPLISFEVKLLGDPQIHLFTNTGYVVQIPCEPTTNLAAPAVGTAVVDNNRIISSTKLEGGGLLVVTRLALFKFMLESVPTKDLTGGFKLSLSSEDISSYDRLVGVLCEYWDSGTHWRNILGKNLTPIQIKTKLTYVIEQNVEIHLLLHLTDGNIILVDAFQRDSNEIWIFEKCLSSRVWKGEKKAEKYGIDLVWYFRTNGLRTDVVKLSFAPSKHGDTSESIADLIEISKLKIERPQEYRELLTILKWE